MNIEEFKNKIKSAKFTLNESNYYSDSCKIRRNKKHTENVIVYLKKCKHCKHEDKRVMYIKFKNKCNMTIFECGFLTALYLFNLVVKDYHRYLDCIVGQKFVENIDSIETV